MRTSFKDRIKDINDENFLLFLLILGTVISLDGNYKLIKRYKENKNPNKEIRDEFLFSNYLVLFTLIIFLNRNINNLNDLEKGSKEYEISSLRILASYFFIFGQLIVIYYLYNTSTFEDTPI